MKILGIDGTGLIGSKLVNNFRQRGDEVAAAAPVAGVKTVTGEGLKEALAGAEVVVDVANSPSFQGKATLKHALVPEPVDYVVYLCADDVWIEVVPRSKD